MPRKIDTLIIHHSAGISGDVETFRKLHISRGYNDIGYHAVILRDGTVQPGRPEEKDGAGVWGNNHNKLHVCLIGQFAKSEAGYTGPPTEAQYRSLGLWLSNRIRKYDVHDIRGHKEITKPGHGTACPGDIPLDRIRAWESGGRVKPLEMSLGLPKLAAEPSVVLDGAKLPTEVFLENGRVTGPYGELLKALGVSYSWDEDSKELRIKTK